MQIINSIEKLDQILRECDAAPDDNALRAIFARFGMDSAAVQGPSATFDPLSREYHDGQMALYRRISGRDYNLKNEETPFDIDAALSRPFPYSTGSAGTTGQHLITIGQFLCCLDLAPGSRVLELGPGWGNLTLALAGLGHDVTAVDVEARFCTLISQRASRLGLPVTVVNGDFTWVDRVTDPFDAIVFFECFHHAEDHLALLRSLHRALKPGGRVYLGAEPILADFPLPWGIRLDGQSLWSIRKFGWMELGFSDAYFARALEATGWSGTRREVPGPGTWILRRGSDPLHIAAVDPRLGTLTGRRTTRGITVADTDAGYCLFGPYEALPAGDYVVGIEFETGAPLDGSGIFDACIGGGTEILGSIGFNGSNDAKPPRLAIKLNRPCTDLELRLWGEKGFMATITAVSIAQSSG